MEKLARAYIEQRIQRTRTNDADFSATILSQGSEKSHAEHAQYRAQEGYPALTANYLNWDTTLSVSQKGEILAKAYTKDADKTEDLARYSQLDELAASYQIEARQLRKNCTRT